MLTKPFTAALVACSLAGLAACPAAAVTITFDNLGLGIQLSNQYAALGATFSANAFSGAGSSSSQEPWATNTDMSIGSINNGVVGRDFDNLGNPPLASGNFVHRLLGWQTEDGDPSFWINFSTPVTSISVLFVGVSGSNNSPDTRLFVYNGNTLLATVSKDLPGNNVAQYSLSFAAPLITRVAVAPGSFNDWVGVDNVVFAPVPELGSAWMLAMGLAALGLAWRRRR